ncbi:MAG: 50S ribosomal protein L10 [Kiritimatiellae bacterium]|nr:50S ribosomal protein L10 [Kiritimatiellia bacterium]
MRLEKKAIVNELRAGLERASFVILMDYSGLKVRQGEELRRRLAKFGARLNIVKNSFFKLALPENRRVQVADVLTSPTAIVFGSGDVVETAKVLTGFQQDQRVLTIKRGLLDGRVLSPADVDTLSKLPAKPVLFGMLVGVVAAPMMQLAGVFKQKTASLVYVLKAVQEKKEKPQ